jgi:hypothetical protein
LTVIDNQFLIRYFIQGIEKANSERATNKGVTIRTFDVQKVKCWQVTFERPKPKAHKS